MLNGVAKTYAMTGWRVGWMIGPPDVVTAATNLQSHQTSNVADVSQRAALAAVSGDLAAVAEMRVAFAGAARIMHEMLAAIPGSRASSRRARSTASRRSRACSGASSRVRTPTTTLELCALLLDEAKVAIVPGEAFGAPGYARISFALGDDAIVEGIERIAKLLGPNSGRTCRRASLEPACLVAEQLAESGLEAMRVAGLEVDEQLDLSPAELLEAVRGAAALVIRSATQVTAEVLDAADEPDGGRPRRHRARQRGCRRRDPPRRDGRQRAAVERAVGAPSTRSRCCSRRPATSRRPTATCALAHGTARSGKASSCTTRCSESSGSGASACSSRNARTRSACSWLRTTPT